MAGHTQSATSNSSIYSPAPLTRRSPAISASTDHHLNLRAHQQPHKSRFQTPINNRFKP
uniref:Uncharacterized protein n=1 Tax=Daucus carota subsp. sativus TaxID=79200 RepID=A0A166GU52_DAUCS